MDVKIVSDENYFYIIIDSDKPALSNYKKILQKQNFKLSGDKQTIEIQGEIRLDESEEKLRILLQPKNF